MDAIKKDMQRIKAGFRRRQSALLAAESKQTDTPPAASKGSAGDAVKRTASTASKKAAIATKNGVADGVAASI